MKIVIVRHGQTVVNEMNKEGKEMDLYIGDLDNELTKLTELGKQQASSLCENIYVKSIEKVYSSDISRAIETALLAKPGYEIQKCK